MAAGHSYAGQLTGERLEIWGIIKGQMHVNGLPLAAYRFTLVSAALGDLRVRAGSQAILLQTYIPQPRET